MVIKSIISATCTCLAIISFNVGAAPPQEPLTVTVQGDGAITSEPAGIACPSDCNESYKKNTTVTLTATADPNSSFLGWDGACVGTDPICVIKMTAPTVVLAMFDTAAAVYPAPVARTGQTSCYDPNGNIITCLDSLQDGEYQAGVEWPISRFVDNGDGTILDNLTGLVWLQDALCVGLGGIWEGARDATNNLADGQCGLTNGSAPGDWRIPNALEVLSLIDFETGLMSSPFINLPTNRSYWTSTTASFNTSLMYTLRFQLDGVPQGNSILSTQSKTSVSAFVMPVLNK